MRSRLLTWYRRGIGSWIFIFVLVLSVGARAERAEQVVREIMKSTVRVVALDGEGEGGHGTGFIISSDGHVATNRHVVEAASRYFITYSDGDRVKIRAAKLVGSSATADLAILQCDPIPGTTVVRLAATDLNMGQAVTAVGFPGAIDTTDSWATLDGVKMDGVPGDGLITSEDAKSDFQPAAFLGAVAKFATLESVRVIFHSAKISPGNSGGPLIDAEGRVCGINTSFVSAETAGADYPISIHASELIALCRVHSIPIDVTSSKVLAAKVGNSEFQTLLLVVIAAFAVVMFLMILRKPRMVADAVSKLGRSKRQPVAQAASRVNVSVSPEQRGSMGTHGMRLRGRDLQGRSYDMVFSTSDFQKSGGKLVIGRNHDLSQLHLAHDSVSRQHATLSTLAGTIHVEDRNSGNGTKVNDRVIAVGSSPVALQAGDKLTLGEVDLIFEMSR